MKLRAGLFESDVGSGNDTAPTGVIVNASAPTPTVTPCDRLPSFVENQFAVAARPLPPADTVFAVREPSADRFVSIGSNSVPAL